MAKKTDTPNLIFRKEWWDNLRHKSPELFKESLSILFSVYFDGKKFDPYSFDEQGSNPTPAQDLAIPMVKAANLEKEYYIAKCERNAANAKKRFESQATICDRIQTQATASDRMQTQGNTIQCNNNTIQDNTIQNYSFFSACEETSPEKEKKELLVKLAFYFIKKGVLKSWTTAEAAWNFNDADGWKSTNKNGTQKDHSKNKLARMKGWQCDGGNYNMSDADFFVNVCSSTGMTAPDVLDSYRGVIYGKGVIFKFDKSAAVQTFMDYYKANGQALAICSRIVKEHYATSEGHFKAEIL